MGIIRARLVATSAIALGFLAACVNAMVISSTRAREREISGVAGTTIQFRMVDAKVKNCAVSEPGSYKAKVGDLIELSYQFPVALPPESATPKKVSIAITKIAPPPVLESPLGIRYVYVPGLAGGGQIRAYVVANNPGKTTVSFNIDDNVYRYDFEVSEERP